MALFATAVVASHGLLDTLTDGGRGVALLWPFDEREKGTLRRGIRFRWRRSGWTSCRREG